MPPLAGQPDLKAVFAAVLVMQALGFLFYAPQTLGRAWMQAWKLKPSKVNAKDPVPFVLSIVQAAVAAMSLDYLMRHLGWTSVGGGLRLGLYIWTGFTLGTLATHYRFARVSTQAFLMDAGFELAQLSAAGLILGAWR
jgi:hypothetical protein